MLSVLASQSWLINSFLSFFALLTSFLFLPHSSLLPSLQTLPPLTNLFSASLIPHPSLQLVSSAMTSYLLTS